MSDSARALRHVVLFGFRPEVTAAELKTIETAIANLKNEIDAIDALEWGTNVSSEGLTKGHTHCLTISFLGERQRDAYISHPAHAAFGELTNPHIETVTVFDYWAN